MRGPDERHQDRPAKPHRRTPKKSPARGALLRLTTLAVFGLIGALMIRLSGCAESMLVYYPSRKPFSTPPGVEDVGFPTTDGLTLHAWFVPAGWPTGENAPADGKIAPTVLHTHGNAGNIAHHIDYVGWLARHGFNVFLFDYRGYGRSDPSPVGLKRDSLVEDANAALDALLARDDVDPGRVGIVGFSLGAVIGLAAAAEREEIRCVVSCAGFSSWKGVAGDHAGPLGALLMPPGRDAVDSVRSLGDRPLLIVHGDADGIVKFRHAGLIEQAAEDAGATVDRHTEPGAVHNRLLTDHPQTRARIAAFLAERLAGQPPQPRPEPR